LNEEIKKKFQITLEKFIHDYPYPNERFRIKGKILRDLLKELSVDQVADELIGMIQNISMDK